MTKALTQALAALSVFATFATLVPADPARAAGPQIVHHKLENGLELVVIPDRRAPVVTHMIWYRVGGADEPAGKSGIAHFLEHLMFKGTKKHPAGLFSQRVSAIGGQENAFTSSDYTGYFQRVPRDHLATVMAFEADRMTGLVLTDENVLPERDVVLEEQNQRVANNPAAKLAEEIQAALYLNHPYGRPLIGWRHEIEKLNRADAIEFYRQHYAPNNAVVVIAGDVEPAAVKAMVDATYGKIASRPDVKRPPRPQEPEQRSVRTVTFADPRVQQESLQRHYLVPSFATGGPGESTALEVLSHILGRGSNSRLYRALVVEQRIAVNAGAWYSAAMLDWTSFAVYGSPAPGVDLPKLEAAIDAVLAEFVAKGVTAEELERSKTKLIADSVYAQDSQSTLARWYGVALTTGATVDDVRAWPERIRAVSAGAVQDAARKWLDKRRSVTGYLIKEASPRQEKRS